jgi:hypothetical protein
VPAAKAADEFYAHPEMTDGTLGVCKVCHRARMKRRRLADPKVQEFDRERSKQPKKVATLRANADRWHAEHPLAYRVRYQINNAIRDGRLFRQPCTVCGATERLHAHVRDYARPLEDIVWLCAQCHWRILAAFPELSPHRNAE